VSLSEVEAGSLIGLVRCGLLSRKSSISDQIVSRF
jgi:hypothetical protein